MFLEPNVSPLKLLMRYVVLGVSGELVSVTKQGKIRVYLQQGRVAWATTHTKERRLIQYIMEFCDTDKDALRGVVEDCVRTKRHFGEVLIERGIATTQQVRHALQAQISETIPELAKVPTAHVLFVPRDEFDEYRSELTFELSEVAGGLEEFAELQAEAEKKAGSSRAIQ